MKHYPIHEQTIHDRPGTACPDCGAIGVCERCRGMIQQAAEEVIAMGGDVTPGTFPELF